MKKTAGLFAFLILSFSAFSLFQAGMGMYNSTSIDGMDFNFSIELPYSFIEVDTAGVFAFVAVEGYNQTKIGFNFFTNESSPVYFNHKISGFYAHESAAYLFMHELNFSRDTLGIQFDETMFFRLFSGPFSLGTSIGFRIKLIDIINSQYSYNPEFGFRINLLLKFI